MLLFVRPSVCSQFFINPVGLFPDHASPPRHSTPWPRLVELARLRSITKRLIAVALFVRLPMVHDYRHWHPTSPHAAFALTLICARRQTTMSTITISLKVCCHTVPGRRCSRPFFRSSQYFQLTRPVELHRFLSGVGNGERLSTYLVPNPKLILLMRGFPHTYGELANLVSDDSINDQAVSQVTVGAFIE